MMAIKNTLIWIGFVIIMCGLYLLSVGANNQTSKPRVIHPNIKYAIQDTSKNKKKTISSESKSRQMEQKKFNEIAKKQLESIKKDTTNIN